MELEWGILVPCGVLVLRMGYKDVYKCEYPSLVDIRCSGGDGEAEVSPISRNPGCVMSFWGVVTAPCVVFFL